MIKRIKIIKKDTEIKDVRFEIFILEFLPFYFFNITRRHLYYFYSFKVITTEDSEKKIIINKTTMN